MRYSNGAVAVSSSKHAMGITRRTVYRYFATTEDLFGAAAEAVLGGFVAQIEAIATDFDDVTGHLVKVVAYIIERLPEEPLLTLLLENDRTNQFSRRMLQPIVIARCRIILRHSRIDWPALDYGEKTSTSWLNSCCASSNPW